MKIFIIILLFTMAIVILCGIVYAKPGWVLWYEIAWECLAYPDWCAAFRK
jgi:hypothetical protein